MSAPRPEPSILSSRLGQFKQSQAGPAIGFSILLLLILTTAWLSLSQMSQNQQQLQRVLHEQVTKLELITQMRHMARERTIAMQKLILLEDPFEQDEIYMAFNRYGAKFAEARRSYIALGLNPEEKAILDRQSELTGINVPFQRAITELVTSGDKEAAHRILVTKAIPGQDLVFAELDKLHSLQKTAAELASRAQAENYLETRSLILLSVAAIVSLGVVVALVVLMKAKRSQDAVFEAKEQALVTLESIGDAVISTDHTAHVQYLNPQAEFLLEHRLTDLHDRPLANFLHLHHKNRRFDFGELFTTTLAAGQHYQGAQGLTLQARNRHYNVELNAAPIRDRHGDIIGTVIAIRDVTALRTLDEELNYQASHDSLTGLLNRREFEYRVRAAIDQARADNDQHAVCYIDLDMFKAVNDTYGHIAGDELLRQLAMLLQESVRKTDTLARVGGDEFALLVKSCDLKEAEILAENVLTTIEKFRFYWENHVCRVGASIGVAPIRSDSSNLTSIMQTADFACYSAKDAGRNRICAAESDTDMVGQRRGDAQWMKHLNAALDKNQFELYCQDIRPLHDSQSESNHVELLLRMIGENGEAISPMAFMPAAERYRLMPAIDRWVITEALELLSDNGTNSNGWIVNINLSGQSLTDRGFLDFIFDNISTSGVNPEQLHFEITETAAISNLSSAIRLMNCLRGIGCHFALDDFGSGLSSFAYLKNLPIDTVKIDGIFVRDLTKDISHRAIVTSIAQVARAMQIKTIAEFVENKATCKLLRDMGVDYAQGYYLCRPGPFRERLRQTLSGMM